VRYKGELLDSHVKLDLLVERTVIVEIKAVEKLIPVHRGAARPQWLMLLRAHRGLRAFVVKFLDPVLSRGETWLMRVVP
jgi:GxxExxY protein